MISPTYSALERTSTRATCFPRSARSTSARRARSAMFGRFGTGYLVGWMSARAVTRGRPSALHFARPPFISRAFLCPYSCSSQNANAANQLLLSPYSTTVVFGVTPASPIS